MQTTSQAKPARKARSNKLVLGFAAVMASAIVGTTGLAAAHSNNNNNTPTPVAGYNGNAHVSADLHLSLENSNDNVITVIFRPVFNIFR